MDKKYIVITRPLDESNGVQKQLENLGFHVYTFPSIAIHKSHITKDLQKTLENVDSFDWIIFTSRNGVRFFMEALRELAIDTAVLQNKNIATVGPKTADAVKEYGLPVHVIPSEFTTQDLAKDLSNIHGKKILLPRANIATPILAEVLGTKGAEVTNIAIYTTEFTTTPNNMFEKLLVNNEVGCVMFTSPSTVEGFLKNIEDIKDQRKIYNLPVLSIGPVTTNFLKKCGFKNIHTADTFTVEGMIAKLKENIL